MPLPDAPPPPGGRLSRLRGWFRRRAMIRCPRRVAMKTMQEAAVSRGNLELIDIGTGPSDSASASHWRDGHPHRRLAIPRPGNGDVTGTVA